MNSKPCKSCKQDIDAEARVCQHCHSFQGWFAGQKDPRMPLLVPLFTLGIALPVIFFIDRFSRDEREQAKPVLEILEHSERYVVTSEGTRIFVFGSIKNTSEIDASDVWLRIEILDSKGTQLDAPVILIPGTIVRRATTENFRVTGLVAPPPEMVGSVRLEISRSKRATKWD